MNDAPTPATSGLETAPSAGPYPPESTPDLPGLWRRMASFMYEGVILFGVVMIAGYLFSYGLQAFLLLILAIYFVWFWTRGGQTVAMKAWHIQLVRADGRTLGEGLALGRFVLSWMWFAPPILIVHWAGLHSSGAFMAAILAWVLVYCLFARFSPSRQFWHDQVCGTRLVTRRPVLAKPTGA